ARGRTGDAIRALMGMRSAVAVRIGDDGVQEEIPIEAVEVGDRLQVRPGERIPWMAGCAAAEGRSMRVW
ncbi:MAG: hypothetical protein AAFS10_24705, partial [Myxococcota bacterium]